MKAKSGSLAKISTTKTNSARLEKGEGRFLSAFENMLEGVQMLGHDWRYLYLNHAAQVHNRRPNQELLGNRYMDMWPGIEDTHVFSVLKHCLEERVPAQLENRFNYPDGEAGWFNLSIQPIPEGILILSFDITQRVRAEVQSSQMKRLYAALSQVNQTIVRVKERGELFQTICDVAVQFGEFSVAWVGLLDENSGNVQPVSANGMDVNAWPFPVVNIHTGPLASGLVAQAIRASKVITGADLQTDKHLDVLHDQLHKHEFHSSAVVPFRLRGKVIGTLTLLSEEIGLFKNVDEAQLLEEMGMDISFALDSMENEDQRKQVEEQLKKSEERYRRLFDHMTEGYAYCEMIFENGVPQDWVYCEINEAFETLTGLKNAKGKRASEIIPGIRESDPELVAIYGRVALTGRPEKFETFVQALQQWFSVSVYSPQMGFFVAIFDIVTGRKQAEAGLQESEEKYRMLFESIDQGFCTIEVLFDKDEKPVDYRFLIVNPAFERQTGISNAVGRRMREIAPLHEEDWFRIYGNIALTGEALRFENPADQLHRYYEVYAWRIGLPEERTVAILFNDITERKQSQEKLLASEVRYRRLFESAKDGILILEADTGKIIDVNPFLMELLGNSQSEFLGKQLWEIGFFKDIAANQESFQKLLDEKYIRYENLPLESKHGGTISVEFVSNVYSVNGRQVIQCNVRDITERKRAEAQIQRQLQLLNSLRAIDIAIGSSFDIYVTLDIVLQQIRTQLRVDAAAILLVSPHGQTIEYAASQGFRSNPLHHTQLKLSEGYAGRAVYQRRTIHIPNLVAAGGKPAAGMPVADEDFVDYYGTPLIAKEEIKGVLEVYHRSTLHPDAEWLGFLETLAGQAAIAIDNAQLFDSLQHSNVKLEQRVVERTAELRHANRTKDEFLANMSHELRTPLNTVLGLSETLLEQRRGSLNEKQIQSLELISGSGQLLLGLINDILEVSKIEAGKLVLHPTTISIKELCESSLNFIKEMALKKSIQVEFINEGAITTLFADPQRFKQILLNLLMNAVKFTPEQGRVSLTVLTNPETDQILFSVEDTGIGIADGDLHKLFTPFTQLDSSLSRQYPGTGLGLTLVQKLTDLHGGSVRVESEIGKGSRFTIAVPLSENIKEQAAGEGVAAAPDTKYPALETTSSEARGIVLLAEDNEINSKMLVEYLEARGYSVPSARDGEEVLEKAEEVSPDIILMDIQMPKMDGLEATRRLRANPRFASTPIIALTALAMPGDRERCLEAGVNEYLSKPVSLKMLLKVIERMTDPHK